MRIAIVNQFYAPDISAAAHLAASLAEDRARRGDEVTVVTSRGGYVPASAIERQSSTTNPKVYRLWTPLLGKGTAVRRAADYATFYALAAWRMTTLPRQDLIILLTTPPFIGWTGVLHRLLHHHAKLLLWNMDCYPEVMVRSGLLKADGVASRLMRAANRALFRRLAHLVCLDTAMIDLLESEYRISQVRLPVTLIPNWEPEALFPRNAVHEPWPEAESLGLKDRFVILYLGNGGVGHEFETVIAAARRLRSEPVMFLFVGGGKHWARIRAAKERYRLDNVVLHGYVEKQQTRSVMAAADCALITLRDEMLGVMSPSKLHSNLAAGLPIIYVGPRKSNVDDAIERFACGVSLRHGDVDDFVSSVRRFMEDSNLLARTRQRARDAFEQAYCDSRTLQEFDEVIENLGGPRGRALVEFRQPEATPMKRAA